MTAPHRWVLDPGAHSLRREPPLQHMPEPRSASQCVQSTILLVAIVAMAVLATSIAASYRFSLFGVCANAPTSTS